MNRQDTDPKAARGPRHPSRKRRRYPRILLSVVLIVAALVAATPALISTPWARETGLAWFNRSIPGEVKIEDMSLSWLGGQTVQGVSIIDADGRPVVRLAEFSTDLTLMDAVRSRLSFGRTVIRGLDADLEFGSDGTTNAARALGDGSGDTAEGGAGFVVPVTGNMALVDARVSIVGPGIDPVVLDELQGSLQMTGPGAPVRLSLDGRSRQGSLQGRIELDGTVEQLFVDGALNPASARAQMNARVEELPVDALDQLLNAGGLLSAALGDRTSLFIEAGGDASQQEVSIDARAPNGELELEGLLADGVFRLSNTASARLMVSPALIEAVNPGAAGEAPAFRLTRAAPLHMTVEELTVPLDEFTTAGIIVRARVHAPEPIRLTDVPDIGDVAVNGLQLQLDSPGLGDKLTLSVEAKPVAAGKTGNLSLDAEFGKLLDETGSLNQTNITVVADSSITGVPTSLVDGVLRQNGLLSEIAGPELALELNADTDGSGEIRATLELSSSRLQSDPVRLTVNEQVSLSSPARIRASLTPALWRRLGGETAGYQLAQPAELTVELTDLRLPVPGRGPSGFQPENTRIAAALSLPEALFTGSSGSGTTRIEALALTLNGEQLSEMTVNASGRLLQTGGFLEALEASPLAVELSARTGVDGEYSLTKITGSLNLDGPGLKTAMDFAVDGQFKSLALSSPANISGTLTPAMLTASQDTGAPAVSLQHPAAFEVTIDQLTLPLASFDYAGVRTEGSARIEPLAVESPGGAVTSIDNSQLAFSFDGGDNGRAQVDVSAGVRSDDQDRGELALKFAAGNLINEAGSIGGDNVSLELNGRLEHLPVALVDQLLNMDGLATATLGATADFDLNADLKKRQGPVTVALKSPNTSADIQAQVKDQGLTLTAPLVAQVQPTPEFGKQVLSKVHPVFETTQRAEQPVRLEIPPDGVFVPLENYDFSRVVIPRMELDFGKIILKSGYMLRGVIGLGQQFGKLESVQKDEWEAWFTPGVLEVNEGRVFYTRRLDLLLAEKLHLATWGDVDVAGDRSNLILAFMPDTMERVFGITVAENDALRVPIEGSLAGPRMDFRKAGADLARLRAQEEVAGENPLAGALLGAVSGKATGSGGAIPEASVSPLPWAARLKAQDAAEQAGSSDSAQPTTPQAGQQAAPAKEKKPSTEEQVIKDLIDIFGNKKKE